MEWWNVLLLFHGKQMLQRFRSVKMNLRFGDMEINCLNVALYAHANFPFTTNVCTASTAFTTTTRIHTVTLPYLNSPFLSLAAKVLWLRRLQHGQGKDQEQTVADGGGAGEDGDHGRPHPHPAGPAPEETFSGGQQTGRLMQMQPQQPITPPLQYLPVCDITPTLTSHIDLPPSSDPTQSPGCYLWVLFVLAFHRTCHDYLLYLFLFWPPHPLKSSYVSRLPCFISI